MGSVLSASPAPRHAMRPPKTNDNSQAFTLAALVGRATNIESTASGVKEVRRESSGLIDLNALARAAEERARQAHSEPPPAAFAREAPSLPDTQIPPSRKLRIAAIGGAASLLAVVGMIVAMTGGDEPKRPAAAAAPAVTQAAPIAKPAEPPKPENVVVAATTPPAADTTAADSSDKAGKGRGKAGHGRNKWSAGPKMTKVKSGGVSSTPAAAPPKPKPVDPCGCNGNLQCAIKCSAK